MALNPQAKAFFDAGREAGAPPLWQLTPVEARAGSAVIVEMIGDGPPVARVEELQIPVRDAVVAGRRYSPEGARGTIVWLHGGGWVFDGLESGDAMCRILANSAAADVVAIDYRVAPEHPFPAPLDDCWDALRWVAEHDDGPLVDRRRQRRREHVGGLLAARPRRRRPCADRADPRLSGDRPRHDAALLRRARRLRAAAGSARDAVVLRPLRTRPGAPREPGDLAVACREPARTPAGDRRRRRI